jgi:hypothetical protein
MYCCTHTHSHTHYLPTPLRLLEFLPLLLLIQDMSAKVDTSTSLLWHWLSCTRATFYVAEIARHQPQKWHGQALHFRA